MTSVIEYDILLVVLIIVAVLLYSAVLIIGYVRSVKEHREDRRLIHSLKEVLEGVLAEVKQTIRKEEDEMTNEKKEELKEGISVDWGKEGMLYMPTIKPDPVNELTLTDLITKEPTDEDYQTVVKLLADLFQKRYQEYKFLIAKSPDEIDRPHLLQVQSNFEEDPYLHKLIFAKCMNTNLDMNELSKRFADYAVRGNVINLGEDAVIIVDDGTGIPTTGVSPVNSGLEDSAITYILGFIKKSNWAEWYKKTFSKTEEAE